MQCPFDVIVVTAPNERSARAYQKELEIRFQRRYEYKPEQCLLLCVSDPAGKRVGSGGGTLNALHHVKRALEGTGGARKIEDARILMIHSGGDSQRSPTNTVCGKAWSALNSISSQTTSEEHGSIVGCNTPIDVLLQQLCIFFHRIPSGCLVVGSSDVLLIVPSSATCSPIDWSQEHGVIGLACLAPLDLGPNHGVYVTESQDKGVAKVLKYMQKASVSDLRAHGAASTSGSDAQVQIDTGVVYFSPVATEALISLQETEPFTGCTMEGVTQGSEVLRLELYSDILLSLSEGVGQSYKKYLSMDGGPPPRLVEARKALWQSLGSIPFMAITPPDSRFGHLGTTEELLEMMTLKMVPFAEAFLLQRRACCVVGTGTNEKGAVILNSIIEGKGTIAKGAVVEHSFLQGDISIGEGALVSGLCFSGVENVTVRPGMCVQEIRLGATQAPTNLDLPVTLAPIPQPFVLTLLAVNDPIKAVYPDTKSRAWGLPWNQILRPLNISVETIWPLDLVLSNQRSLWTARIFPVFEPSASSPTPLAAAWWMQDLAHGMHPSAETLNAWLEARRLSLSEILGLAEPATEFEWRRAIEKEVLGRRKDSRENALRDIKTQLLAGPVCTAKSLDQLWGSLEASDRLFLFEKIEEWIQEPSASGTEWSNSILASAFALNSRILRQVALDLPSGTISSHGLEDEIKRPWQLHALLQTKLGPGRRETCASIAALREECTDRLRTLNGVEEVSSCKKARWLQVAKELELIALQLIKEDVASAKEAVVIEKVSRLEPGQSVIAEAPARADLAGGWSDTPPISYELGGEVTNVAIKIDGKRPIGVNVSRIEEKVIIMETKQANGTITETVCDQLSALRDMEAGSPIALFNCVINYCGIVDLDQGEESLAKQLERNLGYGLKIHSWSDLPTGSGLGTSSILAGTILAAVGRACGLHYSHEALNHAVLVIEQMMGVGGGWQDQVGGLVGGVKRAYSPAGLPLRVKYEEIPISTATRQLLKNHLLLIYTGKQRLARDMVYSVLRRYHARHPQVLQTIQALVENAEEAAQAIRDADVVKLGSCLSRYWQEKKVMAGDGNDDNQAHQEEGEEKRMASSCEPPQVKQLMAELEPHALGMSLMGAGGGGYLMMVTKEPLLQDPPSSETTVDILRDIVESATAGGEDGGGHISSIEIDEEGLVLRVI